MPAFESEHVQQFEIGDYKNFIYLVSDPVLKKSAIIDPQEDVTAPLAYLEKTGFVLAAILLTHTHHDHTAGVPVLLARNPELPVYVHEKDLRRMNLKGDVRKIVDGDIIPIGNLKIRVMHTPGHSSGECTYFLDAKQQYVFTGDTLFIRDCGRTDLDSGSNDEMFASLQKIKALPPDTVILPGHHYREEYFSSLKAELRDSPPLRCKDVHELAALP